jgi:myo-inositol-1(or 4)-monophosphatase
MIFNVFKLIDTDFPRPATDAGMGFRRRGSGAPGLADVAAGLNDAYVELHINARDALASIPLVREAGGLTNDFLEGDGLTRGDILLAVTPELPDRLVELTREAIVP